MQILISLTLSGSAMALVLLVLYLGAALLCMNGTISVLGRMEKELAVVLQLPD